MSDLLPTGHCFDDALEYLNARVLAQPALAHRSTLVLMHGIARATGSGTVLPGELYAHAWCEKDGQCWDAALLDGQRIYYAVRRDAYYEARQIQDTTRYTIRQACMANLRSGHYGPWMAKYRALCGDSKRIMGSVEADTRGATVRRDFGEWTDD